MFASISSVFFCVGFLVLHISAQEITKIPTRFTYPLSSQSVNGSSATGCATGCTGGTRVSDRCQCDDPTSSVVYDGHIPTLTGLNGNMWASRLLTINASSAVLVFDFTGTPNFQVMRVEMAVFNCPQWGISVLSVILTNLNMSQHGGSANTLLSSCDSLVRVCIPNIHITASVLRLEFITHKPTDWIHIAEVTFYGNGHTCPPDIFISVPTTATTSAITSSTTATTSTTIDTISTTTNDSMNQEGVSPQDNSVEVAAGIASGVLLLIIAIVIAIIFAVTCIKRRRGKVCFQNKLKEKYRNESHHNRSGLALTPVNHEETYSQLGETGRNMPQAREDEAYEAYSQLEHTGRLGAGKLSSASKADNHLTQMYAVVNKPKQHVPFLQPTQPLEQEYAVVNKDSKRRKPPSQPTQPSEQEYAVVNKDSKRRKPPSQPTQPSEQEYAVVNKDSKRRKPPSQPTQPLEQEYAVVNKNSKRLKPHSQPAQPSQQEYAVVNKYHPPEVPAKSEDLVEELKEDKTTN